MRSYRRLIVLGLFGAVGVALAMGVALSMAPMSIDRALGSSPSSDRTSSPDAAPAPAASEAMPPPARPAYAQPYPALAEDQAGPTKSVLPEALLKMLLSQQRQRAETVPTPPALPAPGAAEPEESPRRNRISRTRGARGDRFAMNILDTDIREVLDLLSKEGRFNILASPKVRGKVSATLTDVGLESALDAILKSTGYVARREGPYIFVGTPDDFVQMARTTDQINTRIYHPSYITSAELKNLITPILTEGVGVISVTSESETGIPDNMTDAGGDTYAGGDALLVRDYEAVLREVDQLVADVDRRPLQVHIEAMILSVKLDDKSKFGVNFQLLRQYNHLKFGWGTIPSKLADVKFDGGLKFGFLDTTLGSFINALEEVGDTNVIATPRLMVVNKHAAEIQIGKSEGYVNTTQTETAATQTVEFLELGTLLRIRPFISNDGMIRLEVHPEISDGDVDVVQGFTLPHKEVTQVTTNIMVRDGCTAVIGGLLQDEQKSDRTQIPLLGSLPVVGVLFREKEEDIIRHELIILITPNIVRERPAYREAVTQACEFQRRQSVFAEKMSPIGKRALGRKYVRRAKAAWTQGNRRKALRLAELAVHFDPVNREAIELRSDIWLGRPLETPYPPQPGVIQPVGPLDGPQMAPWILEQLGNPTMTPCPMSAPPTPAGPAAMGISSAQDQPPQNYAPVQPGSLPSALGTVPLLDPTDTLTVLPTPPRHLPPNSVPSSTANPPQ